MREVYVCRTHGAGRKAPGLPRGVSFPSHLGRRRDCRAQRTAKASAAANIAKLTLQKIHASSLWRIGGSAQSKLNFSETIRRIGTPRPSKISSTVSIIGAGPQTM